MIDYTRHSKGKRTRSYGIYHNMLDRCYNPKAINYSRYGGRGVKVCDRWRASFDNFLEDMGNAPETLTLDRIDNAGNYSPDNCQWIDYFSQNNKREYALNITYRGKTYTASQWAYLLNMPYDCLQQRLKRGWPIEKAIDTPLQTQFARIK